MFWSCTYQAYHKNNWAKKDTQRVVKEDNSFFFIKAQKKVKKCSKTIEKLKFSFYIFHICIAWLKVGWSSLKAELDASNHKEFWVKHLKTMNQCGNSLVFERLTGEWDKYKFF